MATYSEGMHGAFKGKVGKLVGCSWKGIPYIRALPQKRKSEPSERENLNRKKWALSQHWLQPVNTFVREGFKGYSEKVEGFIAAKSYLLKNAFEGEGAKIYINPALVKVSSGSLPMPKQLAANRVAEDKIQITWDAASVHEDNSRDQIMLLAYNIESRSAVITLAGELSKNGSDVIDLQQQSGIWLIYAAFIASDRSSRSDSVYLGAL